MDPSLLGFQGLREIFNVHPAFVHFPIALLPSALLLYSLGLIARRRSWCVAGRACLLLGAAGAAVTIATGLIAEGSIPHNDRIHHLMETHERIGYLIGALSVLLVGWSFAHREQRPKATWGFMLGLTLVSYLTLQNGDLGGRMVFVEGAGVKPAVPVVTGGRAHHEHAPPPQEHSPHHHAH